MTANRFYADPDAHEWRVTELSWVVRDGQRGGLIIAVCPKYDSAEMVSNALNAYQEKQHGDTSPRSRSNSGTAKAKKA